MIKFQSKEFFFSSVMHFLLWTEYLTYLPFYDWQGSLRVIRWPPDETARGRQQSARIRSGFLRLSSHKEISFLIVWKILISKLQFLISGSLFAGNLIHMSGAINKRWFRYGTVSDHEVVWMWFIDTNHLCSVFYIMYDRQLQWECLSNFPTAIFFLYNCWMWTYMYFVTEWLISIKQWNYFLKFFWFLRVHSEYKTYYVNSSG